MSRRIYMACCTYDNPATMQRECWQDGKLILAYTAEFFLSRTLFERNAECGCKVFFGANIGAWEEGQISGDRNAMTITTTGD